MTAPVRPRPDYDAKVVAAAVVLSFFLTPVSWVLVRLLNACERAYVAARDALDATTPDVDRLDRLEKATGLERWADVLADFYVEKWNDESAERRARGLRP